jgi:hypothetical protein
MLWLGNTLTCSQLHRFLMKAVIDKKGQKYREILGFLMILIAYRFLYYKPQGCNRLKP